MTELTASVPRRAKTPLWRNLWARAFLGIASGVRTGVLTVTTPDGATTRVGGIVPGPTATITFCDPAAIRRLLIGGQVGFAEAYADGQWQSDDLVALFEFAKRNQQDLSRPFRGLPAFETLNRVLHWCRDNSRRGSRRNIAFHYDLGNAFYRLWLDPGMTYSSGLYRTGGESLEQAQAAKQCLVAAMLNLTPGQRVLEIGCGWGGMAEHLAVEHGAQVVGLTLSHQQLVWAKERLNGRAEIRLQDYRDADGRYDRVVSIEMIEAVGERHWPRYFTTLHDRLVPGGAAVIQAITIADDEFPAYRSGCDVIQRHIFPGGMLPCPAAMRREAARAGLVVEAVEWFGPSYGLTLADWRRRFHGAWPEIARLGFDERFRRLWEFYLTYCEAGFRTGVIDVGLWRLRRPATEGGIV